MLADKAALFVDGRYTVQAPEQVDTAVFEVHNIADMAPTAWLEARLKAGDRFAYDPWLHTPESVERFAKVCARAGASLAPIDENPIDAIWTDRPAEPLAQVHMHPARLAGQDVRHKLMSVQGALDRDGLLVSDPHNVAWLFNIRGGDVGHTPLPLSFAFVPKEGRPTLFLDARKLSNAMRARLSGMTEIEEPARLVAFVQELGTAKRRIAFDAATSPALLPQTLRESGGDAAVASDPIALMKARKNATEIAGARIAHIRDGVAVVRFLAWLDREAPDGPADRDFRG